ncbi:MAG TPA: hypothetical protein VFG79_07070, partial [Solirubrobacter sp.]|nr:hypothetical protein [Solirubrobacter sp.]
AGAPERGIAWGALAEKAVLLALISVIFGEILPTVQVSALEVAVGAAAVVGADSAISAWRERPLRFGALVAVNLGLVYLGSRLLSDAEDFPLGTGLFFAFLIALLVTLYDRYRRSTNPAAACSGRSGARSRRRGR